MRSAVILLGLTFVVLPTAVAAGPAEPLPAVEQQWPRPQYPPTYPPPSPRYPPPGPQPWFPGPGPAAPLTEEEWSRWVLRAEEQARNCTRIAVISGSVAVGGFALAINNQRNPSLEDLLAGRTGKMETFANTVGVLSILGGGLALMTSAQCAGYNRNLARQLEWEGQRRGFGPPTAEPLNQRAWLQRVATEQSMAWMGKWMAIGGGLAMAAGGAAISAYDPRPDQHGAARLGPGMLLFSIGFGSAIVGSSMWAHHARVARDLADTPPKQITTLQIVPLRRGVGARFSIAF